MFKRDILLFLYIIVLGTPSIAPHLTGASHLVILASVILFNAAKLVWSCNSDCNAYPALFVNAPKSVGLFFNSL